LAAYRQNRFFDQINSVISVIGFSLPTFFTGLLVILVFGVWLGWFPTIYNTTLVVNSLDTFVQQSANRWCCRSLCSPSFRWRRSIALPVRRRSKTSSWITCALRALKG
jgi:ABC-type dipeptide/oligopeptide/nickel transport system permease component